MRCADVERLADRLAAGRLDDRERAAADAHAAGCEACAELLHFASPQDGADASLTASILARTGGSPCATARALLCTRLDGPLDALDAELVDAHRAGCAGCDATAGALVALRAELPALAELDPGDGFAAAVLSRTSRARPTPVVERLGALAGALGRRLADPGRIWLRPRIALELAYVATLLIAIVVVAPGSPLASAPESAWRLARTRPALELPAGAERIGRDVRAGATRLAGPIEQVSETIRRHAGTFARQLASNTTGQDDTKTTETDDE